MANTLERQIVVDGYRNCVAKFTGLVDTADVTVAPALRLTDVVNNDTSRNVLVGFRVDEVEFAISDGLVMAVEWNCATPQQIAEISGRGCLEWDEYGGLQPDQLRAGFDGAINIRSLAFPAGTTQTFTITLTLVKLYR